MEEHIGQCYSKPRKWHRLASGTIMFLTLGVVYAWSIFASPLMAEFGWKNTETSLCFTFSLLFFCVGNALGGFLAKRVKPRIIVLAGGIAMFCAYFSATFLQQDTLWLLYIFFGCLTGTATGMTYNAILNSVTRWYPNKVGTVSGILMMGYGLSSMIVGSLAAFIIENFGWRNAFLVIGILLGVVLVGGSFFMALPPKDMVFEPPKAKKNRKDNPPLKNYAPLEMVKRPSFWLFFVWVTLGISFGMGLTGHALQCALEVGATAGLATFAVGLISTCNGAGRFFFGAFFDWVGRRKTMLLATLLMMSAAIILLTAIKTSNVPLLMLGYIITGFGFGAMAPVNSAYVNSSYGPQNYAVNFSIMHIFSIPSSFLGPYLAGFLQAAFGTYLASFSAYLGFTFIALAITFLLRKI